MADIENRNFQAEASLFGKDLNFQNIRPDAYASLERDQHQQLQLLTRNHIDSFDFSIEYSLRNGIRYLRPLEYLWNDTTRLVVKIVNAELGKPEIHTECAAKEKRLFPAECRMGGLTYKAPLMLTFMIEIDGKLGDTYRERIGELPLMVKSKLCHLRNLSPKELVARMEEPDEAGGYFILNGREKVIRLLIAQIRNYPIVMLRKSWKKGAQLFSDLGVQCRCVRDDQLSCDMVLHYMTNGNVKVRIFIDKMMVFLPLIMLLKALGEHSNQYISQQLLRGCEHDTYFQSCIMNMLSSLEIEQLEHQTKMLEFIGKQVRPRLGHLGPWHSDEEVGRHFLDNFVVIHLKQHEDKFNFLVFCTKKLFAARRGDCALENVDSPQFQEIYTSGQIYVNYLLERLNMMLQTLRLSLNRVMDKKVNTDLQTAAVKRALAACYSEVPNAMLRLVSTGNINGFSTVGLRQATSFSVMAEKINFCRFISHFRAVHRGAFFTTMRTTEGRKLYPESWGFLCPVHTPDGEPCGLLNHLSLDCTVICHSPDLTGFERALINVGMLPLDAKISSETETTIVLLDGRVIGHVVDENVAKFVSDLRYYKSRQSAKDKARLGASILLILEIGYVPKSNKATQYPAIYLMTSPFRMMRPVLNLSTNRCELIGIFEQVYLEIAVCEKERQEYTTHCEIRQTAMLSLMAGLIPYPDFNQSPRNMYCCQMMKQTMGTASHSLKFKSETKMYSITTPQTPFCRTKFHDAYQMDEYPLGTNAVVAVISYTGYDMEDALILNKASVERGFKNGTITKSHTVDLTEISKEAKNLRFGRHETDSHLARFLDMDGFPFLGNKVEFDDPICSYIDPTTGKTCLEKYKSTEVAYISDVKLIGHPSGKEPLTKVVITFHIARRPTIGDKFANRHGQKGVVSYLYPSENMPFSTRGIMPDIIFNPHGFPSRMTIGQMLESMAGKVACIDGKVKDATPFEFSEVDRANEYYGMQLMDAGFNYYGTETMLSGIDGRPLNADIFMGVVHYIRLRHMVGDKYQVRSTGPIDPTTHQPVKGRKRCGGIRFGEMERDSLLAHGASFLLQDRLFNQSDRSLMEMCTKCGSIISTHPVVNKTRIHGKIRSSKIFSCLTCQTPEFVRPVNAPYVLKYLATELASVNIRLKLSVKS